MSLNLYANLAKPQKDQHGRDSWSASRSGFSRADDGVHSDIKILDGVDTEAAQACRSFYEYCVCDTRSVPSAAHCVARGVGRTALARVRHATPAVPFLFTPDGVVRAQTMDCSFGPSFITTVREWAAQNPAAPALTCCWSAVWREDDSRLVYRVEEDGLPAYWVWAAGDGCVRAHGRVIARAQICDNEGVAMPAGQIWPLVRRLIRDEYLVWQSPGQGQAKLLVPDLGSVEALKASMGESERLVISILSETFSDETFGNVAAPVRISSGTAGVDEAVELLEGKGFPRPAWLGTTRFSELLRIPLVVDLLDEPYRVNGCCGSNYVIEPIKQLAAYAGLVSVALQRAASD